MKILSTALPFGGLGLLAGLLHKPKAPPPVKPVTVDQAAQAAARQDELLRRRGGAADIVTGASGAEAAPAATGKTTLGA